MKRLIAAACTLMLTVLLAIFSSMQLKNTVTEIEKRTQIIIKNATAECSHGEEVEFCRYWEEKLPTLCLFLNREKLESVNLAAKKMQLAAENKAYEEVIYAAGEIESTLQQTAKEEQLNWSVLF